MHFNSSQKLSNIFSLQVRIQLETFITPKYSEIDEFFKSTSNEYVLAATVQ